MKLRRAYIRHLVRRALHIDHEMMNETNGVKENRRIEKETSYSVDQ